MASGHASRINRPNTWLLRPDLRRTEKVLANAEPSTHGTGQPFSTRTGKNALNETVADCMKIWEPATHMSKADWQRTCRRVQGRLDQVTREVLEK